MTEETKKQSSGAGKFFLGAALGALAGAIASKFITVNKEDPEKCKCSGKCGNRKAKEVKADRPEKQATVAKEATDKEEKKTEK